MHIVVQTFLPVYSAILSRVSKNNSMRAMYESIAYNKIFNDAKSV